MSGAVSNTAYGTLGLVLASTVNLKTQVSTLQQQVSTGDITQNYAGLGGAASQVLSFNAATAQSAAYSQSITDAQGKASVMQDVLTQIQKVVTSVASNALNVENSATGSGVTGVAQQAQQALTQVASLLNTQYGGQYVFSGADTANPPIPDGQNITSSGLYTQIGAQVASLGGASASTVIANTVSIASSTAPGTTVFSGYLTGAGSTAASSQIQISPSQSVSLSFPANQNVGATSDTTTNTTGSAVSDILRSLSVLSNLSGTQVSTGGYAALVQDSVNTLTTANQTMADQSGTLGITQNTLTAAASENTVLQTAVTKQLSGLTNVDMATAISQLQNVSTQLEASYNVISMAKSLTLSNYLS
jgi:flagellar hook-associated protein 3 FlgL